MAWLLLETASDDGPDEDEDEEPKERNEEEEIRKSKAKIRSLEDHVNRLHKRLEERDSRIKELEDGGNDGQLRVEAAFWRELTTGELRIADHESAWDLFTARGFADLVKLSDEGEVTDMGEALEKLVDRYPWLADEPIEPDNEFEVAMGRRTAPPPKRKSGTTEPQFDRAQLSEADAASQEARLDRHGRGVALGCNSHRRWSSWISVRRVRYCRTHVRENVMGSTVVRDPIYGLIFLHPDEWDVIDTAAFQRLRGVQQLAMTHLVYPGARHSRFEHCIGAAHVASRLAESIGLGPDDARTRRVRMAALVHDIGHGPFSHVSDEIFENRTRGKAAHETVTAAIVRHNQDVKEAMGEGTADWVADLISHKNEAANRSFERDAVSGPADADKMDYLLRDSKFCGVKYGEYDLAKIVETAQEVRPSLGKDKYLGFTDQGVFPLEEMLLARYHMHRQVYGHKTRVATDRMLVRAMELAIEEKTLDEDVFTPPEEPNGDFVDEYLKLTDSSVVTRVMEKPDSKSGQVMQSLLDRHLFKLILEYDFAKLHEVFGSPIDGFIARPVDRWVIRDYRPEAEQIVAESLGLEPHWVSLYWRQYPSPISRPFSFNLLSEGILIVDRRTGSTQPFNKVSQIFQEMQLPTDMSITLYARLADGDSTDNWDDAKWKKVNEGMKNALTKIAEAPGASGE